MSSVTEPTVYCLTDPEVPVSAARCPPDELPVIPIKEVSI